MYRIVVSTCQYVGYFIHMYKYNTFATASITYIYKCNRWINFINIVYINSTYENLYNFLVYTEKKLVNFNKYLVQYCQLNI